MNRIKVMITDESNHLLEEFFVLMCDEDKDQYTLARKVASVIENRFDTEEMEG